MSDKRDEVVRALADGHVSPMRIVLRPSLEQALTRAFDAGRRVGLEEAAGVVERHGDDWSKSEAPPGYSKKVFDEHARVCWQILDELSALIATDGEDGNE